MPIESPFTHITDLNDSNPVGATDDVSEGDDHIRGLKTVLLTDFPNINAEVSADPVDLNRTDITTEGTGEASKVLTADGSGNVDLTPLTVIADTQTAGNDTTRLATTAFVTAAVSAGNIIGTVSGSNLAPARSGWSVTNPSEGTYTVTHPLNTTSLSINVTANQTISGTDERAYTAAYHVTSSSTFNVYTRWHSDAGVTDLSTGFSFSVAAY